LLTRTGLDWSDRYPTITAALTGLPACNAYLDGEICALRPDGISSFSLLQAARGDELVFFAFDLLFLDGIALDSHPLHERKARLGPLLADMSGWVRFVDHQQGDGLRFHAAACRAGLEGIVSKRNDAPYASGDRRIWLKTKCLNREEFVVVGWSNPEGSRPRLGALLLGYYMPNGRLIYAGRVGGGIGGAELERLWQRPQPLAIDRMPLDAPPPRNSRFGAPLVLSRVHWVRPELVVEVTYLTWTADGLLRQVVYQGVREDKPAREVDRASDRKER
jgi:DNA ligase D-like protein (predicted ligase)